MKSLEPSLSSTSVGEARCLPLLILSWACLCIALPAKLGAADPAIAMPLISRNVPIFASNEGPYNEAEYANDANPQTYWTSNSVPCWLIYNLSSVPVSKRQQVLLALYAPWGVDYVSDNWNESNSLPLDYTVEINPAPGAATPPATGWQQVLNIAGNTRSIRQHLFNLGANWVRFRCTRSSNPSQIAIDLDIYSAPDGASDSWLILGDSITFMSTVYLFSDIPALVNQRAPGRWPIIVPAAQGGTNTGTAREIIDDRLRDFPGRYVCLCYGTNDYTYNFTENIEEVIQKIFAAGKIPSIPHMPWASGDDYVAHYTEINRQIDALYVKYPAMLRGPDLTAAFKDRPDFIPIGDVHPTDAGSEELRRRWAEVMANAGTATLAPNSAVITITVSD